MLPTLEQLLALREEARFLSLDVQIPTWGQIPGAQRSSHRGRGIEFQEVRPYASGDDIRSIDWRVTARRGRLHTKLYHEEREQTVWVFVDLGPGMFFGSRRQTKSAAAVWTAALLAWVASARGARVGALITSTDEPRVFAPRAGEAGALNLLRGLVELQPRRPSFEQMEGFANLILSASRLVRPGSLTFAVSDFALEKSTSPETWSRLTSHSECHLFWITDLLEEHGLPNGRFKVRWPGGGRTLDGGRVRDQWHAVWLARQRRVTELAQQCRLPLTRINTSDATIEVLQSRLRDSRSHP